MDRLAITIGGRTINAPGGIPQGGSDTAQKIIQTGVRLFLIVAIIFGLVYLIFAGIQWIMSRGDKQQLEEAKLKITYAVVGLVIALGGFFIVSFVFKFFNLTFR